MITSPDMVAVALLRADPQISEATQGRVSTDLQPGSPSVRVTLLPGGDSLTEYEWEGLVQVDVWADRPARCRPHRRVDPRRVA